MYSHILERRGELSEFIRERSGGIPFRLLIRSTQYYHDTIIKLYHHNALASEEKQAQTNELLSRIMHSNIRSEFTGAVESELRQMMRGDIPYVYTYANSADLYSDGEIVAKNVFETTAAATGMPVSRKPCTPRPVFSVTTGMPEPPRTRWHSNLKHTAKSSAHGLICAPARLSDICTATAPALPA